MVHGKSAMPVNLYSVVVLLVLSLATAISAQNFGALDSNFYSSTCPNVEEIVREAFNNQVQVYNIFSLPANILRLAFHDCAVDGCEGSVLLSSTPDGSITDEKLSPNNIGLGNIPVITYIKQQVDSQCSHNGNPVVSCADIVALAGREAYNFAKVAGNLGETIIPIGLGRRDGTNAQTSHANAQLLPPTTTVDELLSNFGRIGLNTKQCVALIGSHTIGGAHCVNVMNRLYPTPDSTLSLPQNLGYEGQLRGQCPQYSYSSSTLVDSDPTPTIFDNEYFGNVNMGRGLMTIDNNLNLDSRTSGYVQEFSYNQADFFQTFAEAYQLLTSWQVLTGSEGQIRRDCTLVNSS